MQEVMTAAYKTSARVYRQDLSIAPLASQGLPFLGVPLACRERGDRDMARLAAGLMPPMTGCWSRRYCSVGAEGEGFEPPDLSVSCFQVTFRQFRRIRPRSPALKNPPAVIAYIRSRSGAIARVGVVVGVVVSTGSAYGIRSLAFRAVHVRPRCGLN